MLQPKNVEPTCNFSVEHHISQWLQQRQSMLAHYGQLCATYQEEPENLPTFCQLLMDYISLGHFKMFEKLSEFYQSYHPENRGLDINLLNKISLTTDVALDFNDKYTNPKTLESLSQDLSYLGEHLASRMDWEDELIKTCSKFYVS